MSSSLLIWVFMAIVIGLAGGGMLVFVALRKFYAPKQLQPQLESVFKGLAADALNTSQGAFLELAKRQLQQESESHKKEVEHLVKPLADTLEKYKKELHEVEAQRNKEYGSLDRLMKSVLETHHQLRSETSNLVNALKRPTVRGRWGEVQLRRVVELAGLSMHCDFSEQLSVEGEEGRLRPDMVINLPNGRQIVVDAKAVLAAYLDAESATDDRTRKEALTRHALSLKTRIQELSRKSYWEQFQAAPEFVVLFIPGEAFFSAALEESPDLVELGFEQRVILSTPTTLMALLRAVAYGWRQEQLAENARRISEVAARLHQGLSVWTGHLTGLGQSLDRAVKSYNSAVGSLERTVLPPARRLKEFGVATRDEIDELAPLETALRGLATEDPNGPV